MSERESKEPYEIVVLRGPTVSDGEGDVNLASLSMSSESIRIAGRINEAWVNGGVVYFEYTDADTA